MTAADLFAWQERKAAFLAAWADVRRILLVRLDNLGDVLLTTPAIRAIKRSQPGARITLLTSPVGASVGALDPDVDETIAYAAPFVDPWLQAPHEPGRELALVEQLRARAFDGAIIFTSYHQSPLPAAMLCYLAGIPLRLGATDDGAGSLLTTRYHWPEGLYHEVERALHLVRAAGYRTHDPELVLRVPPAAAREVRRRLAQEGVDPARRLVVVHPGCSMPARTYPEHRFAQVADLLVERLGAQVVLTGSPAEHDLVERVRAHMRRPALAWTGSGDLAQLAALIRSAALLITNNTGPAHVAAAVKTPVVDLFAWTNPPEQWHPWHVPYRLLNRAVRCKLCYQRICPHGGRCLRVPPAEVVAAAAELTV